MALSNIAREPRREITESVIGIVIAVALIWADYEFGTWLEGWAGYDFRYGHPNIPWPLGMGLGVASAMLVGVVVFATHKLGETVCDKFEDNGIHLRPRKRYQ